MGEGGGHQGGSEEERLTRRDGNSHPKQTPKRNTHNKPKQRATNPTNKKSRKRKGDVFSMGWGEEERREEEGGKKGEGKRIRGKKKGQFRKGEAVEMGVIKIGEWCEEQLGMDTRERKDFQFSQKGYACLTLNSRSPVNELDKKQTSLGGVSIRALL